jgi:hypothetical protein
MKNIKIFFHLGSTWTIMIKLIIKNYIWVSKVLIQKLPKTKLQIHSEQ